MDKKVSTTKPVKDTAMDVAAWTLNITSAVSIIFLNKILMGSSYYGFTFVTTLTAFHFLCSGVLMHAMQHAKFIKPSDKPLSRSDLIQYIIYGSTSVIGLNLSLVLNHVGFYQMMKLTILPTVAFIEVVYLGKRFKALQVAGMVAVVSGVAIVTITDKAAYKSLVGLSVAIMGVISASMQQILCGKLQRQYQMSSIQLMQQTMYYLGSVTLLCGPGIDRYITGKWVFQFSYTVQIVIFICLSCLCAILVNLSQFMCLGRFSAATFSTMGHSKTILVLLGAWLFLGEPITQRVLSGMILAMVGMILYMMG